MMMAIGLDTSKKTRLSGVCARGAVPAGDLEYSYLIIFV
jgi:hypothetical protein